MDKYKAKMMKNIGPGGFKCSCCNPSRGKLKNSHVGKDNSLNKLARTRLKREILEIDTSIEAEIEEREYIYEQADHIDIIDCHDEFNEYYVGFKDEK